MLTPASPVTRTAKSVAVSAIAVAVMLFHGATFGENDPKEKDPWSASAPLANRTIARLPFAIATRDPESSCAVSAAETVG